MQWEQFQQADPAKAETMRESAVKTRSLVNLVRIVKTWYRERVFADDEVMREVSKRKFWSEKRDLGYSEPQIHNKWEKATTSEKFKSGMARMVGKKVKVLLSPERNVRRSDLLRLSMQNDEEENWVSKAQGRLMMQGKGQLHFDQHTTKTAFGGSTDL